MQEMNYLTVGGVTYAVADKTKLPLPAAAQVGQVIQVAAVDENGQVTATQTADMAQTPGNLEQPEWGSSTVPVYTEKESAYSEDHATHYVPMTLDEYNTIIDGLYYEASDDAWYSFSPEGLINNIVYIPELGAAYAGGLFKVAYYAAVTEITKIPAEYLDLGDMETALDGILAIQNELIGGDAE